MNVIFIIILVILSFMAIIGWIFRKLQLIDKEREDGR